MKKLIVLLAVFVASISFAAPNADAQTLPYSKGDILVTPYVSLPGVFSSLLVPPIGISGEYGIVDFSDAEWGTLGVGGAFDLGFNHYTDIDNVKQVYFPIQVSAFASYHYFFNDQFTVHAKSGFGLYHVGYSHHTGLSYYEFVGASYFFKPTIAVTAELGYSAVSVLHLGVTFAL